MPLVDNRQPLSVKRVNYTHNVVEHDPVEYVPCTVHRQPFPPPPSSSLLAVYTRVFLPGRRAVCNTSRGSHAHEPEPHLLSPMLRSTRLLQWSRRFRVQPRCAVLRERRQQSRSRGTREISLRCSSSSTGSPPAKVRKKKKAVETHEVPMHVCLPQPKRDHALGKRQF